jgi:mRNA interferase HicA
MLTLMNSSEFSAGSRSTEQHSVPAKARNLKVYLNGKQSILPMHAKELKKGLVEGIKKQLGLK